MFKTSHDNLEIMLHCIQSGTAVGNVNVKVFMWYIH